MPRSPKTMSVKGVSMTTQPKHPIPIGFQVAVPRASEAVTFDRDGKCYRDGQGNVAEMCTHITDPAKKEWDD